MSRCLVMGGAGFMGEAITRGLLAEGAGSVRVFDLPDRAAVVEALPGVDFIAGDYVRLGEHDPLFEDTDTVIYLSTDSHPSASMQDPERDARNNILPAIRMMESCRHFGVRTIVFASSGGTIYGDSGGEPVAEEHAKHPLSAYGVVKLAIEHYLQLYHNQHGINTLSLRVANAYGPGQLKGTVIGAVAAFMRKIMAGETIEIWGDGEIVRDYVWIDDIVNAFVHFALHGQNHASGSYNVGSGAGHSLNQLIQMIAEVTGRQAAVRFLPARGFDVPHIVLDSGKLTRETAWRAKTSLEDGIRSLFENLERTA